MEEVRISVGGSDQQSPWKGSVGPLECMRSVLHAISWKGQHCQRKLVQRRGDGRAKGLCKVRLVREKEVNRQHLSPG